uniref:Putative secreted protein n=1 Tax=Amblyomma americanum TaxID=6943 RepID=A0A0C9SE37_AMBAM
MCLLLHLSFILFIAGALGCNMPKQTLQLRFDYDNKDKMSFQTVQNLKAFINDLLKKVTIIFEDPEFQKAHKLNITLSFRLRYTEYRRDNIYIFLADKVEKRITTASAQSAFAQVGQRWREDTADAVVLLVLYPRPQGLNNLFKNATRSAGGCSAGYATALAVDRFYLSVEMQAAEILAKIMVGSACLHNNY